ncbi:MAG: GNAT family N-acetyltransferase [Bacteroidales bacterium]|nr:GNAT family N-acetyltransferase [Bacteroidales bacterium]
MEILELNTLSDNQITDLLGLMHELDPEIAVSAAMLRAAAEDPSTHLFAAVEDSHIIGCASLCVTHSPTGAKGGIEDVVVSSACRGRHLGRALIEHILDYACRELSPIDMHLTSRPSREAANRLYQSLGFFRYDTNVYKLKL